MTLIELSMELVAVTSNAWKAYCSVPPLLIAVEFCSFIVKTMKFS